MKFLKLEISLSIDLQLTIFPKLIGFILLKDFLYYFSQLNGADDDDWY
jgi:hypothetical protein